MAVGDILRAVATCCILIVCWTQSITAECEAGYFGPECRNKCYCADNTSCGNSNRCQRCEDGWFGSNCQYKCHCANNAPCNNTNPCQSCEGGWFGPDCQYVDVAYNAYSELRDGKDSTCYTPSKDKISIVLVSYFYITWIRVHVNNPDYLLKMNINLQSVWGSSVPNITMRNVSIDNKTVDFYFNIDALILYVQLSGIGVKYLCSVYISGGRNIALRQQTSQSTSYNEKSRTTGGQNITFASNRAVDGDTSQEFYKSNFCSSTEAEVKRKSLATFNVSFSMPQTAYRILIYLRKKEIESRRGLKLFGHSVNPPRVKEYEVGDYDSARSIRQSAFQTEPITLLNIEANNHDNILSICEVEIFGDSVCKDGQYGRECEHTCNCANKEPCYVSTGACPSGCAPGFTGVTCDQKTNSSGQGVAGAVVGALVGVIILVIVVLVVIYFMRKRQKRHSSRKFLLKENPENLIQSKSANVSMDLGPGQSTTTTVRGQSTPTTMKGQSTPTTVRGQSTPSTMKGQSTPTTVKGQSTPTTVRFAPQMSTAAAIKESDAREKVPCTEESQAMYTNMATEHSSSTSLTMEELLDFMKSKDRRVFHNQFNKIAVNQSATMNVALSPENSHKNRYKNISAYDHSRVHLTPNVDKRHGDYINASYIRGYSPKERFIASQGPSKLILEDFLRMLWEQEVDKVVMLTNLVEEGKQKCEQYWPDDGEITFGEITVQLARTQKFAEYTIRRLQLLKANEPTQTVTQFHFTAWPDKDVPTGPFGLVDFEQRVASYPTTKNIVVHCSAGVGRTGTFIALRNVMRQAEETGHMDFFTTVQKLRQDRINMVQTLDQYIFLHKAAYVAFICMGTTLTAKNFINRNQTLGRKSEQTKIEEEYKAICRTQEYLQDDRSLDNGFHNVQDQGCQKNRFSSIMPNALYRPVLECEDPSVGNYINAVLVPSFTKKDHQIVTQLPLPSTTIDFWRLIIQFKVTLVVAFETDLKSTDPSVGDYLPLSENQPLTIQQLTFKLKTEPVNSTSYWKQSNVYVTVDEQYTNNIGCRLTKGQHQLTHLMCTGEYMDSGFLLALVEQIRSVQSRYKGRVLFTCRDGATYSGLACVLSLLLDRMDNDQCLTVPLVVGAVKAIRPQVIPSLDQYKLLYNILQVYSENMSDYTNLWNESS